MTDDVYKSRSQARREHLALKELGKQLAELSESELRQLPLSESSLEALLECRTMTRGARQRQHRYITGLLAEHDDEAALREGLARILRPHGEEVAALHEVERWRERLLGQESGAIEAFLAEHPGCDRQRLTQLVRNALKERDQQRAPKSSRALFRYLREFFAEGPP